MATGRLLADIAPCRLQDADDQQQDESQHDDANEKEPPRLASAGKVTVVLAPVPRVGIIRVG
jgi:hypothetical protein